MVSRKADSLSGGPIVGMLPDYIVRSPDKSGLGNETRGTS